MADPGAGSFTPVNIFAMLRALVNNGCPILSNPGAPSSGASGTFSGVAGKGALLIDYTNSNVYQNTGTLTSPTWTLQTFPVSGITTSQIDPSVIQIVTGTISSANITGTAAGQLGHANGVILQAAPAAGFALQLISFAHYYTFATAAYTAGGNTTVNWGAGGAALTGLVSAANGIGKASSNAFQYFPLSTAGVAIVSAAALNFVSSAAFTQPGTAAGTINWMLAYRLLNVGF